MFKVGDVVEIFGYSDDPSHVWNGQRMTLEKRDGENFWYGIAEKPGGCQYMYTKNLRHVEKPEDFEFDV